MREIKFRGKTPQGKWVYGSLITGTDPYIQGDGTRDYVIPETVGQFTGMRDKNGKDIYEGDILSYKSANPKHSDKVFNNVVEFATGQSLCGWRMRNRGCVVKATPYKFMSSEIIGKIHDNPELLNPKP